MRITKNLVRRMIRKGYLEPCDCCDGYHLCQEPPPAEKYELRDFWQFLNRERVRKDFEEAMAQA